jgi:hypothetical protein
VPSLRNETPGPETYPFFLPDRPLARGHSTRLLFCSVVLTDSLRIVPSFLVCRSQPLEILPSNYRALCCPTGSVPGSHALAHALPRFCVATMMKHSRFAFGRTRSRGFRSPKTNDPAASLFYYGTLYCSFWFADFWCVLLSPSFTRGIYALCRWRSKTKEQGAREPYTHGSTRIRAHVVIFHGLPARRNAPSRQLQGGSLSQVQVFLIRVLVFANPCVVVQFMHGDWSWSTEQAG